MKGVETKDPAEIMYKSENKRLETFQHWNISFISPKDLANSGFISTGEGDKVRCPFCSYTCEEWVEGDDPYEYHLKDSAGCNFISVLKNHEGILYYQLWTD